MTRREALLLCREQWQWLSENPNKNKHLYFEENRVEPHPISSCYCCEFCIQYRLPCSGCPLKGYAWGIDCMTTSDSYYCDWHSALCQGDGVDKVARHAQQMVDACTKALDDLGPEG